MKRSFVVPESSGKVEEEKLALLDGFNCKFDWSSEADRICAPQLCVAHAYRSKCNVQVAVALAVDDQIKSPTLLQISDPQECVLLNA